MKAKNIYNLTGAKSQQIRDALTANPTAKVKDIMKQFDCSDALVYAIRAAMNIGRRRVTKKSKAKAKVVNATAPIRVPVLRGRPPKAKPDMAFMDASRALQAFVKDVKGLCISFDQARDKIDVLWNEELYQVTLSDLPKAIDSIKYLSSRELTYTSITNNEIID